MLTVAELAKAKGFTVEELSIFGVRDGNGVVEIPYHHANGVEYERFRERSHLIAKAGTKWGPGSAGSIPYGLYQPVVITDSVCIVEGESDSWALWTSGIAAIGIPGATNQRCLRAEHVGTAHDVHVIQEPDEAGGRFPHLVSLALYDTGFTGQVYGGQMLDGYKDPQEAFAALPRDDFKALMQRVVASMTLLPRPIPITVVDNRSTPESIGSALLRTFDEAPDSRRYTSTIPDLDRVMKGGFHPNEMTLIGAWTGTGKTGWGNQIALAISHPSNAPYNKVLCFPLELRINRTERQMLAKLMGVDEDHIDKLKAGSAEDKKHLYAWVEEMQSHNITMMAPKINESFDYERITEIIVDQKPDVVLIDQLQCIDDWAIASHGRRSDQAAKKMLDHLHALSEVHGFHSILIHQLKPDEMKKSRRPGLYDFADGAALPRTADTVIGMHRPFKGMTGQDGIMELLVLKNRRGWEPWLHTKFVGTTISLAPMTQEQADNAPCCAEKEEKRQENKDQMHKQDEINRVREWLQEALTEEPMPANDVVVKALTYGIQRNALFQAAKDLAQTGEIIRTRASANRQSLWSLPMEGQ